jgi:putative SOS response-associated peptidase YedK
MCCRYYILPKGVEWDPIREAAESARVMRRFRAAGIPLVSAGEVRPCDTVPAMASDRQGGQQIFPMRWGFRQSAPDQTARPALLINARSETAAEKPSFREAWRSHRCAVPATGYYELARPEAADRRTPGIKYVIEAPDQPILWLCGLYRIEAGLPVFVILTRSPVPDLAPIHDRMPLILPDKLVSAWVDPRVRPESLLDRAVGVFHAEKAG